MIWNHCWQLARNHENNVKAFTQSNTVSIFFMLTGSQKGQRITEFLTHAGVLPDLLLSSLLDAYIYR